LNACAANQFVLLGAGTFRVNSSISIPSNVTLRGSGADQTILSAHGSGSQVITMGSGGPNPGLAVNMTDASAGAATITVASATDFTVGGYVLIAEYNNPNYVTNVGQDGACTWCDDYWNGKRVRGQIVRVTSKSGNTIGISPKLYSAYSTISGNPTLAVPFNASVHDAGVESLQIYANNSGYTQSSVTMSACMSCWLKGIETNYADADHVWVLWGYADEIRDSYFSNGYTHGTGGTNNCLYIGHKTSGMLIENNIFERLQLGVMLGWGAAGNVIGYNYGTGFFQVISGSLKNLTLPIVEMHSPHPQFNLIEGNVGPQFLPDGVWGSSSHNTVFRNWMKGTQFICSPTDNSRGTVNCSNGHWAYQAARAMEIDFGSTRDNFVGNIVGSGEMAGLSGTLVSQIIAPTYRPYDGVAYGWTFGYDNAGDTGGDGLDNTNAYTTASLNGNYNTIDAAITWASGATHTLPASFYLSSKPGWWSSSVPYPATGPDVSGGPGPAGHSYAIPAQVCHNSVLGGTDGGAGSPLAFSANKCYGTGGGTSTTVAPPTGLTAIVN
jgi:hypothetical protein